MAKAKPSFQVHARGNHLGAHAVYTNKVTLQMFLGECVNINFDTADLHSLSAKLSVHYGGLLSAYHIEYLLGFCQRLHTTLPLFRHHAIQTGVVSSNHIIAMERLLQELPDPPDRNLTNKLDSALVKRFTPTIANQQVPTVSDVKRWLKELLKSWRIETEEAPTPVEPNVECCTSSAPGMAILTAELDSIDVAAIYDTVQAHAKANDITPTQALVELICNNGSGIQHAHKFVLFGLGEQKPDHKLEATWLNGVGPLTKQQRETISNQHCDYRDAYEIAKELSEKHDPSLNLRMLVILRDGTCRFPGCNHPASQCDIDHVINWEAGGWTTLSNLQCLCRNHHNAKTDRRVRATMTKNGHVTWYTANGTLIATTIPTGPLAEIEGLERGITTRHSGKTPADDNTNPPTNNGLGRWGYTIFQKRNRIRKRRDQNRPPPEPEPPLPKRM
ncbi:MAG: HNH endonuclease signature motif containing protein [Corynebacterium sp.]|nr:HNH endonuclease signature motif containing protein [Corynebacterium sp.]